MCNFIRGMHVIRYIYIGNYSYCLGERRRGGKQMTRTRMNVNKNAMGEM